MRIKYIEAVRISPDVESRLWAVNYGQTISKFATCVLRAHVALVATSVFRNGPRGIFSRPFGSKSWFRSDTLGVSPYPSKRWDPLCGSPWICVAFKVHSVLWEITVFHVFSEALEESFQKPNQTDVRHYRRKFPRQPKKTKKKIKHNSCHDFDWHLERTSRARRTRRAKIGARRDVHFTNWDLGFSLNFPQGFHAEVNQVSFRFPRSCLGLEYGWRDCFYNSWLRQP